MSVQIIADTVEHTHKTIFVEKGVKQDMNRRYDCCLLNRNMSLLQDFVFLFVQEKMKTSALFYKLDIIRKQTKRMLCHLGPLLLNL